MSISLLLGCFPIRVSGVIGGGMISGFFPARKRLQHHAGLKHSPVAHDLDMNPTAQIIAPERV